MRLRRACCLLQSEVLMTVRSVSRAAALPLPLLALAGGCLLAACAVIARSQHAARPAVAFAVSADLTLPLPALYWLLVVRTGRARVLTLAPVFLACLALAALLLPAGQRGILPWLAPL